MEQITKQDGVIYYGKQRCNNIDDAYDKFRTEYHRICGKDASKRLDRLGQRVERIHEYGYYFTEELHGDSYVCIGKIPYRIMGFLGICYVRSISLTDYEEVDDEEFDDWLDWVFRKGSGMLRLVGKNNKTGRTSTRINARYR
jgi:hypothetical protein